MFFFHFMNLFSGTIKQVDLILCNKHKQKKGQNSKHDKSLQHAHPLFAASSADDTSAQVLEQDGL